MTDHIKTIREALDEYHASLREGITQRYASELYNEARAALDSLEAELATLQRRVEMNELAERIQELHEERHDLESRARLGAKPTKRLAEVHAELDRLELREDELRKGITERMMAHLRSRQPETEEQRQRTGWARIACAELNAAKARDAEGGKS